MKKDTVTGIIVFTILLLLAGGVFWYTRSSGKKAESIIAVSNPTGNPSGISSESYKQNNSSEYIAALYVEGTIEDANSTYNQKWLLSTINQLKRDSNNVAIAMPPERLNV